MRDMKDNEHQVRAAAAPSTLRRKQQSGGSGGGGSMTESKFSQKHTATNHNNDNSDWQTREQHKQNARGNASSPVSTNVGAFVIKKSSSNSNKQMLCESERRRALKSSLQSDTGDQMRATNTSNNNSNNNNNNKSSMRKAFVRFDDYLDLSEENMRRSCKKIMNHLYADPSEQRQRRRASPVPRCASSSPVVVEEAATATNERVDQVAPVINCQSELLAGAQQQHTVKKSYLRSQYERRQLRQMQLINSGGSGGGDDDAGSRQSMSGADATSRACTVKSTLNASGAGTRQHQHQQQQQQQQQQDLVSKSHELSKRKFFDALQRRGSSRGLHTSRDHAPISESEAAAAATTATTQTQTANEQKVKSPALNPKSGAGRKSSAQQKDVADRHDATQDAGRSRASADVHRRTAGTKSPPQPTRDTLNELLQHNKQQQQQQAQGAQKLIGFGSRSIAQVAGGHIAAGADATVAATRLSEDNLATVLKAADLQQQRRSQAPVTSFEISVPAEAFDATKTKANDFSVDSLNHSANEIISSGLLIVKQFDVAAAAADTANNKVDQKANGQRPHTLQQKQHKTSSMLHAEAAQSQCSENDYDNDDKTTAAIVSTSSQCETISATHAHISSDNQQRLQSNHRDVDDDDAAKAPALASASAIKASSFDADACAAAASAAAATAAAAGHQQTSDKSNQRREVDATTTTTTTTGLAHSSDCAQTMRTHTSESDLRAVLRSGGGSGNGSHRRQQQVSPEMPIVLGQSTGVGSDLRAQSPSMMLPIGCFVGGGGRQQSQAAADLKAAGLLAANTITMRGARDLLPQAAGKINRALAHDAEWASVDCDARSKCVHDGLKQVDHTLCYANRASFNQQQQQQTMRAAAAAPTTCTSLLVDVSDEDDEMRGRCVRAANNTRAVERMQKSSNCGSTSGEDGASCSSSSGFGASVSVTSSSAGDERGSSSSSGGSKTLGECFANRAAIYDEAVRNTSTGTTTTTSVHHVVMDSFSGYATLAKTPASQYQQQQQPFTYYTVGRPLGCARNQSGARVMDEQQQRAIGSEQLVGPDQAYPCSPRALLIENHTYASFSATLDSAAAAVQGRSSEVGGNIYANLKMCRITASDDDDDDNDAVSAQSEVHSSLAAAADLVEYASVRARPHTLGRRYEKCAAFNESQSTSGIKNTSDASSVHSSCAARSTNSAGFSTLPPAPKRAVALPQCNHDDDDAAAAAAKEAAPHANRKSLLRRFGSLVSRAFTTTSTSTSNNAPAAAAAAAGAERDAAQSLQEEHVNDTAHNVRAQKVCEISSPLANASAASASVGDADLVILPTKHSSSGGVANNSNNKAMGNNKRHQQPDDRLLRRAHKQQQQQQQRMQQVARGKRRSSRAAIDDFTVDYSRSLSCSSSSSSSSSTSDSATTATTTTTTATNSSASSLSGSCASLTGISYSSSSGAAAGHRERRRAHHKTQRIAKHHHRQAKQQQQQQQQHNNASGKRCSRRQRRAAAHKQRRSDSLSEELESLMSRSESSASRAHNSGDNAQQQQQRPVAKQSKETSAQRIQIDCVSPDSNGSNSSGGDANKAASGSASDTARALASKPAPEANADGRRSASGKSTSSLLRLFAAPTKAKQPSGNAKSTPNLNDDAAAATTTCEQQAATASGLWGFSSLIGHSHAVGNNSNNDDECDTPCNKQAGANKRATAKINSSSSSKQLHSLPQDIACGATGAAAFASGKPNKRRGGNKFASPEEDCAAAAVCANKVSLDAARSDDDDDDDDDGRVNNGKFHSLNLYQNLLRNYTKKRRERRHHSHHHSHHHHHHNAHHAHHAHHEHAHAKALRATLCGEECAATDKRLSRAKSRKSTPQTSAGDRCKCCCCKSAANKCTVWGQLIKINKSDGTQVVELQRQPGNSWGFFVARGAINSTKGIFISRVHDSLASDALQGLLGIGDRIVAIDECAIEPDHDILRVNQLISKKTKITLKVKPYKC